MPELPDLHVFAKNLRKLILNKEITTVEVFNKAKINKPPNIFAERLIGTSICDVVRDGKEMKFLLSDGSSFNVHLMLSGRFSVCSFEQLSVIYSKIVVLRFEDDQYLAVSDVKGLCKVTIDPKRTNAPDAMSEAFTYAYFLNEISKNARKNIKAFLIDQNIVRGIGNAYVDEILWKADISPESIAGKISDDYLNALYQAIPCILNGAIENIEKISPDIISGEERSFLKVHNPRKKQTDDGDKILVKEIATKKTYYTERQILFV